jgi:5-(carboxyamino)imidazole ribonucleotide mutase/phosphoribosylamine--glycine ligase
MGLGSAGAKNAALFVIEILALHDESMKKKLIDYRTAQKEDVMKKAANVERGVPGG